MLEISASRSFPYQEPLIAGIRKSTNDIARSEPMVLHNFTCPIDPTRLFPFSTSKTPAVAYTLTPMHRFPGNETELNEIHFCKVFSARASSKHGKHSRANGTSSFSSPLYHSILPLCGCVCLSAANTKSTLQIIIAWAVPVFGLPSTQRPYQMIQKIMCSISYWKSRFHAHITLAHSSVISQRRSSGRRERCGAVEIVHTVEMARTMINIYYCAAQTHPSAESNAARMKRSIFHRGFLCAMCVHLGAVSGELKRRLYVS